MIFDHTLPSHPPTHGSALRAHGVNAIRTWEARRRPYLSRKSSKKERDEIVLEEALFRNPPVVSLGVTTHF
ncbi:unnamed protein product [Ectocarpus sp. CCAP 1310/34]|nr:unnamed protein product [Ectocarpus sp. CCAP 1310/34]